LGWKLVNVDSPGNADVYGGDDIKKIMKLLSGYDLKIEDVTDGVDIGTEVSFSSEKLKIKSPTTGFNYIIRGQDIAADRIISLPLMTDDGEISLAAAGAVNDWGAFMQTFRNQNFKLMNPANTFGYIFNTSAITTADKNVTLPLLTADDTFVFANMTQTLTNKTLTSPTITAMTVNTDTNTIKHSTTNNSGDLLVNTGTKFDRLARGTADQIPIMNPTGTGLTWIDKSSVSGGGGGGSTGDYQVPTTAGNIISASWYGTGEALGDGIWSGFLTNTSNVTPVEITDSSGRMGLRYNFLADDDRAGFRTNRTHFNRLNDPELVVRYRYYPLSATHTSSTNYRVVVGFTSDPAADFGSDGALDNTSAFMWFKETADTTTQVGRNDGDATTDKDATVSLTQTDANTNRIRVFSDSANNRFGVSLNGANATYFTTEIPAAATRLGCIVQFENENSDDRSFEILGASFKAKVI
jgi:hypothetical protein